MSVFLPNGSTVGIAATYDAPVIFTAITNATEASASSVGHDLEVGDFVEVTSGWARLSNRVVRIKSVTADAFVLESVNTLNAARFIAGAGAGSVRRILTWTPISQVTESSKSGGEQQNVTYSFLEEDDEHQIPTSKSALSFTLTMADDPSLPHNDVLLEADDDKKPRAVRVNLASGGVITYNAFASFDNVPSLTKNNIMAVTAVFAVVAKFIRYAA
ncbi:phage tail protein [Pseudomonas sp. Root329]|uniref:phage tail protein n=1 Tax=Pseudomonas sp. Root329 TaxID=1736515 RepID=UPI0006FC5B9A|nr:phage tail protein [Pseudomonas sp. Root329]KQV21103.1 phage tail protein [Pseudomonas sp. Root329]